MRSPPDGRQEFAPAEGRPPYINLIAVRAEDRDAPWVAQFVNACRTDEVRQFVTDTFQGAVVPAW